MAGGKRPGSGRPKGVRSLINVRDYFTEKELEAFWDDMKQRAKTDSKIALYFAEQLTGKAAQAVNLGDSNGNPLTIQLSTTIAQKNDLA